MCLCMCGVGAPGMRRQMPSWDVALPSRLGAVGPSEFSPGDVLGPWAPLGAFLGEDGALSLWYFDDAEGAVAASVGAPCEALRQGRRLGAVVDLERRVAAFAVDGRRARAPLCVCMLGHMWRGALAAALVCCFVRRSSADG